jgi:chemotaxis-related protein WspD
MTAESAQAPDDRGPAPPAAGAGSHSFFDRPPPADYLQEWSERLARPPVEQDDDLRSFVVFRLDREWLALPAVVFSEITEPHPVHSIPHRSNDVLLGMVNIRGQLRLAVSLHGLFGVAAEGATAVPGSTARMLILRDGPDQWVCPAEEVAGIQRVAQNRIRGAPSTFSKAGANTSSVFDWNGHTVGVLQPDLLFTALRSHCR